MTKVEFTAGYTKTPLLPSNFLSILSCVLCILIETSIIAKHFEKINESCVTYSTVTSTGYLINSEA